LKSKNVTLILRVLYAILVAQVDLKDNKQALKAIKKDLVKPECVGGRGGRAV
jgi:hypothetical protein